MSEVTYKKIVDVEQIDTLGEGTTLFVNDGGSMKQVAADKFGGVKTVNGIAPDENGDIAVEIPEPVQPDWNQNDETKPDYVKNRTHWVETKRETIVEETTITGANGQFTVISALKTDGKYIVNYNGTEYECMPKTDPSGDLALGNLSIAKSTLENTGEPFLLTGMSSAGAITYALFADRTGTHVFAAFEVVETIHTIDPKYLPEDHINKMIDSNEKITALTEELKGNGPHQMFVTDAEGKQLWEERTHYSEYLTLPLVDETIQKQQLFPGFYMYSTSYLPDYPLELGAKCIVEIHGVQYECEVLEYGEGGVHCLGNRHLQAASAFEDTGEPFFFNTMFPGSMVTAYFSSSIEAPDTVKITGPVKVYKQIPSEYVAGLHEGEGRGSVVFGGGNTATGSAAFVEGAGNAAGGYAAHAEGCYTIADGSFSHAEGEGTIANGYAQHVDGKYNIEDSNNQYIHIAGNGVVDRGVATRSNAHTLDWSGNAWYQGNVYVGGTSQADGSKLVTESDVNTLIDSKLEGAGGGSGGAFVVNVVSAYDEAAGGYVETCDKTKDEIKEILMNGGSVTCRYYEDDDGLFLIAILRDASIDYDGNVILHGLSDISSVNAYRFGLRFTDAGVEYLGDYDFMTGRLYVNRCFFMRSDNNTLWRVIIGDDGKLTTENLGPFEKP